MGGKYKCSGFKEMCITMHGCKAVVRGEGVGNGCPRSLLHGARSQNYFRVTKLLKYRAVRGE